MHDPVRMVFINVIASLIVLFGTLIYRFVYPKKKVNLFFLFLIISFLPILSIFRAGDYESGDFNIHIYRIMSFYDSLSEGHFMPSWAAELNATYGNPLFIFNYSLPYYAICFFHLLGESFINSMKIYLGLNLFLSGIFMYMLARKLIKNSLAAFTSAIFYVFNPYHLIDIHFRATLGESTIFTLVPLLLLLMVLYLREKKFVYLTAVAFVGLLLFLAHPLVAGIFIFIFALFAIFSVNLKKDLKSVIFIIIALIIGGIGSSYSWLSFIIYSRYMPPVPGGVVFQFDTPSQVLYAPWRFGFLFQGPKGELAPIIGYTQIFVVIVILFLFLKRKIAKKLKTDYLFWLSIMFTILFFMSSYSKPIWNFFPFLLMLESNRLLLPIALCTSLLAGYLALSFSDSKRKRMFIYTLLVVTIGYTILNWGHRRVIPQINDADLRKNVWISTVTEGTTAYFLNNKWADINNFWFSKIPNQHLEIVKGSGKVKEIKRTSTEHEYTLTSETPIIIKENTLFYPGWRLKTNNRPVNIYPGKRGVIYAVLPTDAHFVDLYYEDILPYKISKIVSASIFGILLALILLFSMVKVRSTGLSFFKWFTSNP